MKRGIAKRNIGTAIRAPYEAALRNGTDADAAVYAATIAEIDSLGLSGSAKRLGPEVWS